MYHDSTFIFLLNDLIKTGNGFDPLQFLYRIFPYIFRIAGPADHHYGDNYSRRFYIRNETDGECKTKDNGWLLVGDDKGACNYERDINKKPFILFSNPPSISKGIVIFFYFY